MRFVAVGRNVVSASGFGSRLEVEDVAIENAHNLKISEHSMRHKNPNGLNHHLA